MCWTLKDLKNKTNYSSFYYLVHICMYDLFLLNMTKICARIDGSVNLHFLTLMNKEMHVSLSKFGKFLIKKINAFALQTGCPRWLLGFSALIVACKDLLRKRRALQSFAVGPFVTKSKLCFYLPSRKNVLIFSFPCIQCIYKGGIALAKNLQVQ